MKIHPLDPVDSSRGSPHVRIIIYIPKLSGLEHFRGHHMRGCPLISEGGMGVFIKKWVPELINVPISHIHEPWKMTTMEQTFYAIFIGKDYPKPIVDLKESSKMARDKIWGHKKHPAVRKERNRLLNTHVNKRHSDFQKIKKKTRK